MGVRDGILKDGIYVLNWNMNLDWLMNWILGWEGKIWVMNGFRIFGLSGGVYVYDICLIGNIVGGVGLGEFNKSSFWDILCWICFRLKRRCEGGYYIWGWSFFVFIVKCMCWIGLVMRFFYF